MASHNQHFRLVSVLSLLCGIGALGVCGLSACRSANYGDPEYLASRLPAGDERAFREASRMTDPAAHAVLVPALIEAYNGGIRTDDVVRILLDYAHPDGLPVFLSALSSDDNRMAGVAARGIAAIGSLEHAGDVAQRLRRVRDPNQYEAFLDALKGLPGQAEVAPVIVEILSRPAGRIGGIGTVRLGCEILGQSGATDAETVAALLFGLVNFELTPFRDASQECALALVQVGDPAVEALLQVFRGEDAIISGHLQSIGMNVAVGGLRAARVLADIASPAALEPMVAWFSTDHVVTRADLEAMSLEQAMNWFENFGQQFLFATEYLEYVGQPGDEDPAHQTLRGLIARGEESLLEHFRWFMGTGDDAELGLRSAVIDALANVGDPADRDLLYEIAQSGTLGRLPNSFIRKHAAHAFVLLAQPGDLARYDVLIDAAEEENLVGELNVYRPMLADVSEACQLDAGCLTPLLGHEDRWVREKAAFDLAHFTENGAAAAGALLSAMESADLDTRFLFLRQLRHLPLPQTGPEQVEALIEAAEGRHFRDFRQQLELLLVIKGNEAGD